MKQREPKYWLMKSEPAVFSFQHLWKRPKHRSVWDGVRNYQARNFMRDEMQVGDGVLFYHSSSEPPGVAGIARVSGAARPDPTQFDPRSEAHDPKSSKAAPTWLAVEIEAVEELPRFVALADLRAHPALSQMLVIQRGQRLSIQPVRAAEWDVVLELGGLARPPARG